MRVLIADDDAVTRVLVEKTLSRCGYEVVSCSDGAQAWDKLRTEDPPELAVLDRMMPGVDGLELCRRIRQSPNAASTYPILLTGQGQREDIVDGLNAGAYDYMVKPFDVGELSARVRVGERLMEIQGRRLNQETERYVERLEVARAEAQRSRQRIVAVQEEARKHVAGELHGPIQSKLSVLTSKLGEIGGVIEASSQEVQKELAQTAVDLDRVRENDVRMVSHALHTSILEVGLRAGIKTVRDQFESRIPISLEISQDIVQRDPPGSSTIPFGVRVALYRVAHEAMGNVVRHAGASQVSLRLDLDDQATEIALTVEDDGRGFEPQQVRPGLGTLTMQDYVEALGGALQVDTASGNGTRVRASVPLKEDPGQLVVSDGVS